VKCQADHELHISVGRDGAGRVVEVSVCDEEGAALLRRMT